MAALVLAPVWFAMMDDDAKKTIAIFDESGKYKDAFENTESLTFKFIDEPDSKKREQDYLNSEDYAMLSISDTLTNEFILFSDKSPDLSVKEQIVGKMERFIEAENLRKLGINKADIDSAKVDIYLETYTLTDGGKEKSSAETPIAIGFVAAIIIYMFIFMYGVQVMKGVIEEKINRVVEVLVSSVKPFQLMAGKIIGIAMVALTQFLLWIVLTGVIVLFVGIAFGTNIMPEGQSITEIQNLPVEQIGSIIGNSQIAEFFIGFVNFNWFPMIMTFIFFFLGGYLLYASLFAAIGSAVDNETDTQQFMLPVTVPLILAFVAAQGIIRNPDGALAFWMSVIPFTSPIIMPVRVAMGRYEVWELLLSIGLLVGAFIATVWLAAKIYKVGILMYGKKVSYKELWKWLRYK